MSICDAASRRHGQSGTEQEQSSFAAPVESLFWLLADEHAVPSRWRQFRTALRDGLGAVAADRELAAPKVPDPHPLAFTSHPLFVAPRSMSPKDSLIKYRQGVINKNHVEAYRAFL